MFNLKRILGERRRELPEEREVAGSLSSIPRRLTPTRPEAAPPPPAPAPDVAATETRVAPRFVPRRTKAVLVSDGGKKVTARIINVSATGVAVEADFSQVSAGSIVMAGERRVSPGRKIARGTVFLFEKPLPESLCGPDFIL